MIPLTILLKAGIPYKGMDFNGVIRRINLDELSENNYISDSRKISGSSNNLFRVCRSLLFDFARNNKYNSFSEFEEFDDETLFCSAVYVDGERENISLRKFDLLIRNETWRKQVLFIQGYVKATSTQSGYFGSKKKVSIKY